MTDVAILVPVLKRPGRVVPFLESLEKATPEPHRVIFIANQEDVPEIQAVRAADAELLVMPGRRFRGDYARKINHGYRSTYEPVLFLAADDLDFRPGWLSTALAKLDKGFQVVGTNDLGNKRVMLGIHSTHTFVTRDYVDRQGVIDEPGAVLHEGYNHWYVDDEFIQTAQYRDVWSPCLESHVEHLHYAWKKSGYDRVYRIGESRRTADRQRYAQRCHLWGIEPPQPRAPQTYIDPTTGILTKIQP